MSVIADIVRTVRWTKFTRATQPRKAFAVCIMPASRDALIREMESVRLFRSGFEPQMFYREIRVDGALIGRVEA